MFQPSITHRISACHRPEDRRHIMYQKWRDLLFIHWEFPSAEIQKTLPAGLTVDTFNGKAYLGVVPFFMCDVRPRFCPAVPGISDFLEMNLRTYVFDKHGRPGVWFYSLDANQWLAVKIARSAFNLPYFHASMTVQREPAINFAVTRKGCSTDFESRFRYLEVDHIPNPSPDSLEFFLIERYYLFATNRAGSLFSGKVYHTPYPLRHVNAEIISEGAIALAGFDRPGRPPDHAIMSRGVDVQIFPIERVV